MDFKILFGSLKAASFDVTRQRPVAAAERERFGFRFF